MSPCSPSVAPGTYSPAMKIRYRVLGLLVLASVICYVDRVCISVAGPSMQEDLGLSLEQWGWVLGAFVVSYGAFEIPIGAYCDRVGPRRVLTRIVLSWSLFTALTGVAQSFRQLLAVRFVFGAFEAGAFPSFSAAIMRWFPRTERARAQSAVWMATRLGGALAPLLVIPIQQAFGWRASFFVFGAVGVVWAVAWFFWFRDRPSDVPGITESELSELAPAEESAGVHTAKFQWSVFKKPTMWWLMAMYYANAWCGFFYLSWMYTFLVRGRGFTPQELLALSWLPFLLGAGANLIGGWASDALVRRHGLKFGRQVVGFFGLAAATAFLALTIFTEHKVLTVVWLALAYACSDLALPVAWAVCLDVGGKQTGTVTAAMNTAGQLGAFCTTVAFGYLVGAFGSYNAPLVPIALMSAAGAFAWLRIDATKRVSD
jgi:ACS family glucarate transporter-like MFS transporter